MRYYFYTFFLLFLFIDILFFSIDVFSIDILYQQSLPSYRSGWQFFCVLQHKNAVFHINSHISSSFLRKRIHDASIYNIKKNIAQVFILERYFF